MVHKHTQISIYNIALWSQSLVISSYNLLMGSYKHCEIAFTNRFEQKDSHKVIKTRDQPDYDTEVQYKTNACASLTCT